MKQAKIYVRNILAGILTEDDMGYEFKSPEIETIAGRD